MGKILEKVIVARITFDCGKYSLVPFVQFGGRSHSSCIDAGITLAHNIEAAQKKGLKASALMLDVKGFFDNVNHTRMVLVVHKLGFPPQVTAWVSSFLSDRKAFIKLDGDTSNIHPLDIGVPQGSPVSPVLSIVYASEVLEKACARLTLSSASIPTSPKGYIDDIMLSAFSPSAKENATLLSQATEALITDLSTIGMSIDTDKSDLIHFSQSSNNGDAQAHVLIGNHRVIPRKVVRWLGIYFDSRLTFKEHVNIMANRGRSVTNGLRILGNTVRGLSQANMQTLYRTCVIPILAYASPIWFRPDRRQKSYVQKLQVCQNHALRLICGAFKTTPSQALEVLSYVPPIHVTLQKFSERYALRLARLPDASPVICRLPLQWQKGRSSPPLPPPFKPPPSLTNTIP